MPYFTGEDLVTVLDQLRIKYCIGIGDGAGSNIIVRFGMMNVARCMGVILLNPTTNKATMVDNLKDRFHKWKISHITPTGEHMVAFRKFGHKVSYNTVCGLTKAHRRVSQKDRYGQIALFYNRGVIKVKNSYI